LQLLIFQTITAFSFLKVTHINRPSKDQSIFEISALLWDNLSLGSILILIDSIMLFGNIFGSKLLKLLSA